MKCRPLTRRGGAAVRSWVGLSGALALCGLLTATTGYAANLVTWEAGNSLIDTTNYNGLGQFHWFANFGNTTAVTGAPMDQMEARNLPSWLKLESRPAFIGKDDGGINADATIRTGFSFEEVGTNGSTSTGGQTTFNMLTLPNGTSGLSGQAVDSVNTRGNTASMLQMRILPGAPSGFRMWVVTDNGTGTNFNAQGRMRVSLRNTTGPPTYIGDTEVSEAEAMPSGVRIGQTAAGINGTADAWAFNLTDVGLDDIVTIRPSGATTPAPGGFPAFAGFFIQVTIPEPASGALLGVGLLGLTAISRRVRRRS